jgi:aspartyl-tRNA(Asn)/glutamyl-tRNA(Gln) amidotransferase subunit A
VAGALRTAGQIGSAVAGRQVSPVEVVELALDRLRRWQPSVNCFSEVFAEEALAAAKRAERALLAGAPLRPLAGVPVAVKDAFDVAGHQTTGCCAAVAGRLATRDAELVRRLRQAGAIVLGKTNQHELGCGSTGLVSSHGPVANPREVSRIAGGSSSGSAAALAAGIVPLALGTDAGGSIRVPASFCGVLGLKPTSGRLPAAGVLPLSPSLDCPGPMAASASDLWLLWRALTGAPAAPGGGVRRVGMLAGCFTRDVDPQVAEAVERVGRALESAGAVVCPVDSEGIEDAPEVWNDLAWPQAAEVHGHLLRRRELLSARTAALLEQGAGISQRRRDAARRRAVQIGAWFRDRLRQVDALLAPSTPYPAPASDAEWVALPGGRRLDVRLGGPSRLCRPVSISGLPALAIPAGRSSGGLPLGVQLIGASRRDDLLLSTAALLEACDGFGH